MGRKINTRNTKKDNQSIQDGDNRNEIDDNMENQELSEELQTKEKEEQDFEMEERNASNNATISSSSSQTKRKRSSNVHKLRMAQELDRSINGSSSEIEGETDEERHVEVVSSPSDDNLDFEDKMEEDSDMEMEISFKKDDQEFKEENDDSSEGEYRRVTLSAKRKNSRSRSRSRSQDGRKKRSKFTNERKRPSPKEETIFESPKVSRASRRDDGGSRVEFLCNPEFNYAGCSSRADDGPSRSDDRCFKNRNELEDKYRNDPLIKQLVSDMVSEQLKKGNSPQNLYQASNNHKVEGTPPLSDNRKSKEVIKSPSDSTLYTPAVNRRSEVLNRISRTPDMIGSRAIIEGQNISNMPSGREIGRDNVDEILTKLRLDVEKQGDGKNRPKSASRRGDEDQQNGQELERQAMQARVAADKAILETERYCARLQPPAQGKSKSWQDDSINYVKRLKYDDNEDDDFFHTTCHIDSALKEKIMRGEFVELSKLIQKKQMLENNDEKRMQLVSKGGESYFAPMTDRETKIDSVRKWEQAFRIYTTIYCGANPSRSGEILQYIDVINRAAAIFSWDNVSRYDYVFRHLMAAKPHRSWAKIYTQMWNMNLNEPIKRFSSDQHRQNFNGSGKKKENCCWKYNKGNNCKYGKECRFDHKCSYCGSFGHPASNCHKKKKSDKKPSSSGTPSSSN